MKVKKTGNYCSQKAFKVKNQIVQNKITFLPGHKNGSKVSFFILFSEVPNP
jgi:hypothetical protein